MYPELSVNEAQLLFDSKFWETLDHRTIAIFQLFTKRLCMPFAVFHEAVEKTLGRPVFTHEFGMNVDGMKAEIYGHKEPPTMQEIIEMIPEEKRCVVFVDAAKATA